MHTLGDLEQYLRQRDVARMTATMTIGDEGRGWELTARTVDDIRAELHELGHGAQAPATGRGRTLREAWGDLKRAIDERASARAAGRAA